MDRETLNEMVKLKFGTRKLGGPEIDLVKLVADASYAAEIFSAVENLPDESLVMLAMTLRDKFGLLTSIPVLPSSVSARTPDKGISEPAARYVMGARS